MLIGRQYQRGDTIIEVLLAVVVFSMVAVGAITVMNQGTSSAQRSLEVTLVKQQIDAQAEALRTVQQDYFAAVSGDVSQTNQGAAWTTMIGPNVGTRAVTGSQGECPTVYGDAFAMNARTAQFIGSAQLKPASGIDGAPPYSQVMYNSPQPTNGGSASQNEVVGVYGLWITKQARSDFTPNAYDFTIHACWYSPGQDAPMQLQTTVRLYDAK